MRLSFAGLFALVILENHLGLCTAEPFQTTCAESCQSALAPVLFSDFPANASWGEQRCRSTLSLASTYLCLDVNCGTPTRNISLQRMNASCQSFYDVAIPAFSVIANYSAAEISHITRIHRNDMLGPQRPWPAPVLPAAEYFAVWLQTLEGWNYTNRNHLLYGAAVTAFWILVVAVGFIYRLHLTSLRIYHSHPRLQLAKLPLSRNSWLKRRLFLPATFGYKCAQSSWGCTIPPRLQSITIFAFIALNTAYSVIGYKLTKENYYFDSILEQVLRYGSDRTGVISFINFPIIWLFGMRNNFSLWLTGWDFATYNNFHRWTARVATLQATIHSVGYTVLLLRQGGWATLYTEFLEPYWQAGVLATILMCLLIPLSVPIMRRNRYETFLVIHIGFSVLILFAMLGHVSIFKGKYNIFVKFPVYIWIFDRIMRTLRIAAFRPLSWGSTAQISYSTAADIVQLSVPVEWYSLGRPKPGTFYYLTVLTDARSRLESHPFTVGSVMADRSDVEDMGERTALLGHGRLGTELASPRLPKSFDSMHFIIRPYNGFTARLRDLAKTSKSVKVLVDGPYGISHPLQTYTHVVFITGGTGIVTPISYLPRLLDRSKHVPSIALHWSVREPAFANIVLEQYFDTALGSDNFSMTLHASQCINLHPLFSQFVRQEMGRPNIQHIIESAAAAAAGGRLAVVACGPEGMLDDSRFAIVCALENSQCTIDYFQDSFAW